MRSILVAAAATLLFAGTAHAQELPRTPLPYNEAFGLTAPRMVAGIPVPSLVPQGSAPPLYQLDPRWRNMPLGLYETVGRKGCLVVLVADIFRERGYGNDPVELIRYLSSEFVLSDGRFRTMDLDLAFPGTPKPERFGISGTFNKSLANRIEFELARGSHVVLKLQRDKRRTHWVQVGDVVGNDFLIIDPGRRDAFAHLRERYGTPKRGSEMVIIGPSRKLS